MNLDILRAPLRFRGSCLGVARGGVEVHEHADEVARLLEMPSAFMGGVGQGRAGQGRVG